jgi:hypothetical protein
LRNPLELYSRAPRLMRVAALFADRNGWGTRHFA